MAGLQTTVFSILIITAVIIVFLIFINGKLKKFDPMDEPKGIVLLMMVAVQTIDNMVKEKTNEKVARTLTPYMLTVALYLFMANISGLFALETPTSNYSVTLVLAAITCILIEVYSAKARGTKSYIKTWFEPFAPFVVLNLFSKMSTLLSLSHSFRRYPDVGHLPDAGICIKDDTFYGRIQHPWRCGSSGPAFLFRPVLRCNAGIHLHYINNFIHR